MTLLIQPENSVRAEAGTDRAILYQSGAPSPRLPSQNTWGGFRNSASRVGDCINPLKAIELVEAARCAMAIGLPFNRHLTVHWAKAGLTDCQAAAATGRMIKLIRDWVRKNGGEVAYAWVRENGMDKGTHSHILLHIPQGLSLAFTRRWYRLATGWQGRVPGRALKSVCIGGSASSGQSGSEWYIANLAKLLAYVLKGTNEQTGIALGLADHAVGGSIIGKRIGIAQILTLTNG